MSISAAMLDQLVERYERLEPEARRTWVLTELQEDVAMAVLQRRVDHYNQRFAADPLARRRRGGCQVVEVRPPNE